MNLKNHLLRTLVLAASTVAITVGAFGSAGATSATPLAANEAQLAVTAVNPPTTPRSPAATPGPGSATLYWSMPASSGGATIDRYAAQLWTGTAWQTKAFPTATSFKVTGLHNGTKYSFRVRAHNAAGWGPASTTVHAVPRTKPSAPRSPKATAANASVKLTWLKPSSNGGSVIKWYVAQKSTDSKNWIRVGSTANTSLTATKLTNGTKYYFRVRAHNAAGNGRATTPVIATPHTTAPSAPPSVVATPGKSSVTLSWKQPSKNGGSAILDYTIELSYDGNKWFDQAQTSALNLPIGNMVPGTTYYLRVRARNAVGWSAPSAEVTAVPYTVPSSPTSCTAAKFGQQSISFGWAPPASDGYNPIANYFIQVREHSSNTLVAFKIAAANATSDYATGLDLAYSYDVQVSAVNAAGESSYCEVYVP
jgi:titin